MELLIALGLGLLALLAFRKSDTAEADPSPGDGGSPGSGGGSKPPTIDDLPDPNDTANNPAFIARRKYLEGLIFQETGQRVTLIGCADDQGKSLNNLLRSGLGIPKGRVCSIALLENEYLMVMAKLGHPQGTVPGSGHSKGEQPTSSPRYAIGQEVTTTAIPRTTFHVAYRQWHADRNEWMYRGMGMGGWHFEGQLTGEDLSRPEPSTPTPFQKGDRVIVRTNIGDKEGVIASIRWDGLRLVYRYTVNRVDGVALEYSESQLTRIASAQPALPLPRQPKYRPGDRVVTGRSSVSFEVVATWRWDAGKDTFMYTMEDRPFTSWDEDVLRPFEVEAGTGRGTI